MYLNLSISALKLQCFTIPEHTAYPLKQYSEVYNRLIRRKLVGGYVSLQERGGKGGSWKRMMRLEETLVEEEKREEEEERGIPAGGERRKGEEGIHEILPNFTSPAYRLRRYIITCN